ncbi:uncharacterized protein LOC126986908 isoform X2 [Eriocheir sinensis]|nr:uncharacterized protein LOC126986908 isoform X2 [Eriocheir sinensis]
MARCALCHQVFSSRLRLVEHFGEAHSIARQRSRRSKVSEAIRKVVLEAHDPEVVVLDEDGEVNSGQHQCCGTDESQPKKQPVVCQYCGQRCKDRRGAAIHQAFCEKKLQNDSDPSPTRLENPGTTGERVALPECPADDCGAIFKTEEQLARHMERHHGKGGDGAAPTDPPPVLKSPPSRVPKEASRRPAQLPLVTVTMKPHVGKTEGLQDLSLLITPTKAAEESPEYPSYDAGGYSSPKKNKAKEAPASITVEECRGLDPTLGIKCESVLYVTEDGTVLEDEDAEGSSPLDVAGEEETFIIEAGDGVKEDKWWKCTLCQKKYVTEDALIAHESSEHSLSVGDAIQVKQEPMDADDDYPTHEYEEEGQDDDDEDWELVTLGRKKKTGITVNIKGKLEYQCNLCKRHFLSELGYQAHVRSRECKNKKFKLPRMFSCHFKQCDSTFFKLTELQRHWQIAHKYSMTSKNLEFEDERSFTDWLIEEEEKHKVRFTCDVRRRKPHRSERLLVCHRFHHLRTAAARKNANREYSDRHNWVHKIQPCLCFARLKVYQQFNEETCGYTGKISVVYYPEHSHPQNNPVEEQEEVLDHVLQRNKRNRNKQFQELKGSEKLLHRQKLVKFARLARKDCPLARGSRAAELSKKPKTEPADTEKGDDPMVQVDHNLLGSDELFSSQVEMVLDGQFDMDPEELAEPVVTPMDTLQIFSNSRGGQGAFKVEEDLVLDSSDGQALEEQPGQQEEEEEEEEDEGDEEGGSTVQAVLPATTEDWGKVFEMVRARVAKEEDAAIKAAAALLLPYERVIELVTPAEQVPIFRQLWDLACSSQQAQEGLDFEIMVMR